MNHSIVYCSPNGSTRHVVEIIAQRLSELGARVGSFDLGRRADRQNLEDQYRSMDESGCLWVGSPVYVDHMVPPMERFLRTLPERKDRYAVPFVTWGGVNSGTALYEMGEMLIQRGYILLGAAKVMAVHSSMWRSKEPLGAGHPSVEDDAAVRSLTDAVHEKLSSNNIEGLPLERLDYQPELIKEEARHKSLAVAKQAYPRLTVEEQKCIQCGECIDRCPAGVITLDPYPQFGEECFICLKCVRECPEQAIPLDLSAAEARIRGMALAAKETPPTRIFV